MTRPKPRGLRERTGNAFSLHLSPVFRSEKHSKCAYFAVGLAAGLGAGLGAGFLASGFALSCCQQYFLPGSVLREHFLPSPASRPTIAHALPSAVRSNDSVLSERDLLEPAMARRLQGRRTLRSRCVGT